MERETMEITGYKKYNERLGEGERERKKGELERIRAKE